MKIAIHYKPTGFPPKWINYCQQHGIPYKLVDCYSSDIIDQLSDCEALMWHHHQALPQDLTFAKQLLFALQQSGKTVFPDFNTGWHFDDKAGQKYLLESIDAPTPSAYLFYSKKTAMEWAESAKYPVVFKLRSGAGALNVRLVKGKSAAKRLIRKAFGRGFSKFDRISYMKDRVTKSLGRQDGSVGILKGIGRLFIPTELARKASREKGYVYFQEFLPGNKHDIRIIVIKDKAFGIKRLVRKNDFRASGGGMIVHDREEIDIRCVEAGLNIARKLGAQCIAFDFVYKNGEPLILEISYGFSPEGYDKCPGYWDENLDWHEGPFDPYGWMVDNILTQTAK